MEKIYFLSLIAICVAALLLLVWRGEKRHSAKLKARKKKADKRAKLHSRHESVHRRAVQGHTASRTAYGVGVWEARNQRAAEEMRDGTSFAANRLYSDAEKSKTSEDLAMGAIQYTPEDRPKILRGKR